MTYVYLDANIYNDIERAALPVDDVRDFQAAVVGGELVVRGSIVDLEGDPADLIITIDPIR